MSDKKQDEETGTQSGYITCKPPRGLLEKLSEFVKEHEIRPSYGNALLHFAQIGLVHRGRMKEAEVEELGAPRRNARPASREDAA